MTSGARAACPTGRMRGDVLRDLTDLEALRLAVFVFMVCVPDHRLLYGQLLFTTVRPAVNDDDKTRRQPALSDGLSIRRFLVPASR